MRTKSPRTVKKALAEMGDEHYAFCEFEAAIKCYDRALKLDPKDTTLYARKGRALLRLKRCEEAIECFGSVLKLDPRDMESLNNKGVALCTLGRYSEALGCFQKVLAHDPKNEFALGNEKIARCCLLNSKGLGHMALEKPDEALVAFSQALDLIPGDPSVRQNKESALKQVVQNAKEARLRLFDKKHRTAE